MARIQILLADRDQSYLEDAQRVLRLYDENYVLQGVTSAAELIDKITADGVDLLLLDSHLGDGDYLSVLDQVVGARPDLPVVVLVDEGRDDLAIAALRRGAYDYVMKTKGYLTTLPFTVRKAVGHRALRRKVKPVVEKPPAAPERPVHAPKEPLFAPRRPAPEPAVASATAAAGTPLREEPLFAGAPEEPRPHTPPWEAPRSPAFSFAAPAEELFAKEPEPAAKAEPHRPTPAPEPSPAAAQPESRPAHEAGEQPTASCVVDQKLRILSANKTMESLTDYSDEELLELTLADLFAEGDQDHVYRWFEALASGQQAPLSCTLIGKKGKRVQVELAATPFREGDGEIAGYRVRIREVVRPAPKVEVAHAVDQLKMVDELAALISACYGRPLAVLLDLLAKVVCQVFHFKRCTVALLDRRRKVFVKQAMVGYRSTGDQPRTLEVPAEVIDRVFARKYRVKVLYYNRELRDARTAVGALTGDRRTQDRRPVGEWHRRDLVLINLLDAEGRTFGYISLDDPLEGFVPNRDTFHNLEIFGRLAALIIENYWHFSTLERRTRRLKQILATSNIFKLYLSLSELLKEVVWSIKFSLDFNLVVLALVSKRTQLLEVKAIACEDKIKQLQIGELAFELEEIAGLLQDRYRRNRSYFVDREEPALAPLKAIYRPAVSNGDAGMWPTWGLVLVPLVSRSDKIIGFLVVDDPVDGRVPSMETIRTLEMLANQVAIAIDNRVMYVELKRQLLETTGEVKEERAAAAETEAGGLRKLMDRLFH
ncbi:MAG: PAS domain-containing protein [bacterium]|jgi:PAS domain S-box-containing protein|nr:PAS domain-containing protein [candidate division KSB1 bacterium]MDH7560537.1 PAS domain-containing protein [bacterium]